MPTQNFTPDKNFIPATNFTPDQNFTLILMKTLTYFRQVNNFQLSNLGFIMHKNLGLTEYLRHLPGVAITNSCDYDNGIVDEYQPYKR